MKTDVNEVIFCLGFLGEKVFVNTYSFEKQKHVYDILCVCQSLSLSLAHTRPRARARPALSRHLRLLEELRRPRRRVHIHVRGTPPFAQHLTHCLTL